MGKSKKLPPGMTVHHIIPTSRTHGYPLIAPVSDNDHQNLNRTFGSNALPIEMLDRLVYYYWAGNDSFIYEWIEKREAEKQKKNNQFSS